MKRLNYEILGIFLGLLYWLTESEIHRYIWGEDEYHLIPTDYNELWMRSIIFIMIVAFGFYAENNSKKLMQKEQEKLRIYSSTVHAVQHILNNFLTEMQMFLIEVERCQDFDKERVQMYEDRIQKASEQIKKLGLLSEVSEESIDNITYSESNIKNAFKEK